MELGQRSTTPRCSTRRALRTETRSFSSKCVFKHHFSSTEALITFLQLYASSSTYGPPYPAAGLTFVQG